HSPYICQNSQLWFGQVPRGKSASVSGCYPREVVRYSRSLEIHSLGPALTADHFGKGISAADERSPAAGTYAAESIVISLLATQAPKLKLKLATYPLAISA